MSHNYVTRIVFLNIVDTSLAAITLLLAALFVTSKTCITTNKKMKQTKQRTPSSTKDMSIKGKQKQILDRKQFINMFYNSQWDLPFYQDWPFHIVSLGDQVIFDF